MSSYLLEYSPISLAGGSPRRERPNPHSRQRLSMGGQPYQPFAVEQKNQQKEGSAERNPFADQGWANATSAPTHNPTAWQDVHLDQANAGYPSPAAAGPKTADQPPAWAYAAAAPTWDAPPQSTPALGNTADPMHNAPAFYGSGPPEFNGQTIYNVNQADGQERCRCNLDWWMFGIGFFTGIAWFIGAFLPYCRNPHHPTRSHHMAHRANCVMSILLIIVIIIAGIVATRSSHNIYNGNCCGYTFLGYCSPC
ncbi:hypothetical protein WJX74_001915 [Apatococcus lobatus]|uniref:Uncharacterized protein n=1 Tax=Apatococcus lobatus TaxID=904363 RepID=A0AAW1REW3_9CHLO